MHFLIKEKCDFYVIKVHFFHKFALSKIFSTKLKRKRLRNKPTAFAWMCC